MVDATSCPVCAADLVWFGPGSEDGLGPLTSELRRLCVGPDPIAGGVMWCSRCPFAWTSQDLDEVASLLDTQARPNPWQGRESDGVNGTVGAMMQAHLPPAQHAGQAWSTVAWMRGWGGLGVLVTGDAWLRAAWMFDDEEELEHGLNARRWARDCYEQALEEKSDFRRVIDRIVVAYLAGELSRKLGDVARAQDWFDDVAASIGTDPGLADLAALAQRQLVDPVDHVPGK